MQERKTEDGPAAAPPPLRLGRTLRYGIRAAWDALGFVCAMSLTLFACGLLPALLAWQFAGIAPAIAVWLALAPPLFAGACRLTHSVFEHDEPAYSDLWRGFARLYVRAVALGAAQFGVTALLAANILFYLSRSSFPFLLLALVFTYLLLFWAMNCLYHWPLLVAAEAGIIRREDGGEARLRAVFRNGFLLAFSAPGFTFVLLLVIMAVNALMAASGVGMALLSGGFTAFLTTQAARDQLVRFGVLPPPPDPDAPAADEGWKLK
jgi:uncharacterized membrane protein YesL